MKTIMELSANCILYWPPLFRHPSVSTVTLSGGSRIVARPTNSGGVERFVGERAKPSRTIALLQETQFSNTVTFPESHPTGDTAGCRFSPHGQLSKQRYGIDLDWSWSHTDHRSAGKSIELEIKKFLLFQCAFGGFSRHPG